MKELLTPLIQTEIIIRLLASPAGQNLRGMLHNNTSVYKIANAVNWFKENYAESITMDMLAAKVHMNTSTFRQLFKKVTSMSPLQYLKTIRLQNARNFMLSEDIDAASAAIRVGYESISQFSREYKRYFGTSPKQDVKNMRI
ncbi:MAG: AraC family transcriptional regulator [Tolumonas sp.]|nr:AraC family transcriptional regulator [Tolumonas sp.]